MYLSRLQLNSNNRQVWREHLRNPYKVHQMVMRGFPDGLKREEAIVLYRLEMREEAIVLLVQSVHKPDWSTVEPAYLAPADPFDLLPNPAVKPLLLPLQAGQIFSFRLCANPTFKKVRRDENGERDNSNRVPLLREDEQIEWLQNRAEAGGFRVLQVAISQAQNQKLWKEKGQKPITFYTVHFDGQLQVTQPDKLTQAIKSGIGPSRAFGCGLLSLARG